MQALALILLSIVPQPEVVRGSVDRMELNHFYNEEGWYMWTQLIFWDWDKDLARHSVTTYRMVRVPSMRPTRDHKRGGWVSIWDDEGVIRVVRSKDFAETWSQHDPEVDDREVLPQQFRRQLPWPVLRKTRK
jgi:hypothetical protein